MISDFVKKLLHREKDNDSARPLVMVIDDEPSIRRLVTLHLTALPVEVVEADCSQAALDILATSRMPGLFIVDQLMPGDSGMKFMGKIRSQSKLRNVPFIMLTGAVLESRLEQAKAEIPHFDFMTKPFDGKTLCARVKASIVLTDNA